ncbi:predicted protein [Sclerotinia sclerotiorum 1980 UF-70]|uniref:Uncharacterized protein n=1 Tax=Sclerotinia sclerotiorum (strain ATCC 18683 / 1980 / Ss-1) TaxID=665079 RepID=A7EHW9_SCLS1|nr:predicted protein [Sclerotinia sclerotiorum 1980 UF-70]EDO02435.1 predicted protein [Sclerotinia sclerotiorum 1980 UF-70]
MEWRAGYGSKFETQRVSLIIRQLHEAKETMPINIFQICEYVQRFYARSCDTILCVLISQNANKLSFLSGDSVRDVSRQGQGAHGEGSRARK